MEQTHIRGLSLGGCTVGSEMPTAEDAAGSSSWIMLQYMELERQLQDTVAMVGDGVFELEADN